MKCLFEKKKRRMMFAVYAFENFESLKGKGKHLFE
jgi:hypothetical protein